MRINERKVYLAAKARLEAARGVGKQGRIATLQAIASGHKDRVKLWKHRIAQSHHI